MSGPLRLLGRESPRISASANPIAWLEALGEVQIDRDGSGYRCRLKLGRWGETMLYVWAPGGTIQAAAGLCAERVREMIDAGQVRL